MRTRVDMPRYAEQEGIALTRFQFRRLLKRPAPWEKPGLMHGSELVKVAQLKDGSYWAEWRGSAVFWAHRWFEIPQAAGDRMFDFAVAVDHLLANDGKLNLEQVNQ